MIQADEEVSVTRFALNLEGPTLAVEYKTSSGKIFVRKIRFKRFPNDIEPQSVTNRLIKQFADVLGPEQVNKEQVLQLVAILLGTQQIPDDATNGTVLINETNNLRNASSVGDAFGDLNCVSEEDNSRAKATMNIIFDANAIKPNDSRFVYNKVVEFAAAEESNDWDEE